MSANGRLRVGLDVTPVVTTHGGLARYSEELWDALAARDDVDVSAFALGRGSMPATTLPVRRVAIPLRALRPAWRHVGHPRAELFTGDVDVVHSLALFPAPTAKPRVQTIHDVLPLTHPQFYPPGAADIHREELAAAARANLVVTTCEATARELADVAKIPRERVVVAPPGAFRHGGAAVPSPVDEPYVLAVGQVTPRKGLDVLARAASLLGKRAPRIVVAGPDWWKADEVRAQVADLDPGRRVRLLGAVDDATLRALYEGASVVCHASRAEGFGMTCLEAMRAGAPLVATDLPSVRELTGGAAILVPIDDAEAFAAALDELLTGDDRRHALAAAGRLRAAEFGWDRTAALVTDGYRRARAA